MQPQRVRKKRSYAHATDGLKAQSAALQSQQADANKRQALPIIDQRENGALYTNYEYLDHTADIQFHTWGDTLYDAFANAVICMFNYMTEIDKVEIDESCTREIAAEGHDLQSLLYNFMDECLFQFSTDWFVCKTLELVRFTADHEFSIQVIARGERFDIQKHPQGTEIKAITYSNMQILKRDQQENGPSMKHPFEVYVIVDI